MAAPEASIQRDGTMANGMLQAPGRSAAETKMCVHMPQRHSEIAIGACLDVGHLVVVPVDQHRVLEGQTVPRQHREPLLKRTGVAGAQRVTNQFSREQGETAQPGDRPSHPLGGSQ